MEHLDLTTLADRAGVPLEAARRYRDAYVLFIPAIRVGRTIGFPAEAIDVVRLIADREAAGDDPEAVQAALEATYPVTVLSAQPIAAGEGTSPHAAIVELLRGVDTRYASLATQVAALSDIVAETALLGRPAKEAAELRTMLVTAQTAIDAAVAAAQATVAGQQIAQTAIVDALTEQSLHRATDQATLFRALDDIAAAGAAGWDRTAAAYQELTAAQADLAASTHAEHQALLTASASMAASTHAEHRALRTALDRQKGELAAIREQQTRLQTELATVQRAVPTLATTTHVEQLGTSLAARIGEHPATGFDREEMTAHIATRTAADVGKLLDKREAALMGHIDAQLTALARHVESRVAQLDRRVSAIASLPGDGSPSQTVLLDRITALTRQVSDEAIIQNAAFERIASERDEATRLMGQQVAEALAAIQREVRAGAATTMATQSAAQDAAERATQAAQAVAMDPALDARPQIQLQAPNGQPIVATPPFTPTPWDPASRPQRPTPAQSWTDHLVTINGVAGSSAPADDDPGNAIPRNGVDATVGVSSPVTPAPLTRTHPATTWPPPSLHIPNGAAYPSQLAPLPPQTAPADSASQAGLPNRRRLGHPLRPGDVTQAG